jgi:hypothetical protein
MGHLFERELLAPVSGFLRQKGCSVILPELIFFDRGIDLYGISAGRRKTTYAVELKLTDWRKALRQAAIYQLCSDYSYVALPVRTAHSVDADLFKGSGVGLLSVHPDNTVSMILDAARSTEKRSYYSRKFCSLTSEALPYAS